MTASVSTTETEREVEDVNALVKWRACDAPVHTQILPCPLSDVV